MEVELEVSGEWGVMQNRGTVFGSLWCTSFATPSAPHAPLASLLLPLLPPVPFLNQRQPACPLAVGCQSARGWSARGARDCPPMAASAGAPGAPQFVECGVVDMIGLRILLFLSYAECPECGVARPHHDGDCSRDGYSPGRGLLGDRPLVRGTGMVGFKQLLSAAGAAKEVSYVQ